MLRTLEAGALEKPKRVRTQRWEWLAAGKAWQIDARRPAPHPRVAERRADSWKTKAT